MALCTRMITGKHTGGPVPCGQCRLCRRNIRDKKTARLMLESQTHEHCLFITLTYKQKFLPLQFTHPSTGKYYSHLEGTLDPSEIRNFVKRLRRRYPPKSLRLFYAGEYGDEGRPHFHIILWGASWDPKDREKTRQNIFESWTDVQTGELKCNPERLDISPPKNESHVARYLCKYIVKGLTNESDFKQNGYTGKTNAETLAGRYPEFSRGSLGIGSPAIDALVKSLSTSSGSNSIALNRDIPRTFTLHGKSYPIDRYLREKILDALQIKETVKSEKLEVYDKDLRKMYVRARSNPKIPSSWTINPYDWNDTYSRQRREWALEKQMQTEQAQSVLVKLTRASLTEKGD